MDDFMFNNPVRFCFGKKQLARLPEELEGAKRVMLAYGEGSIKESGLFDRIVKLVESMGARVVEFGGITGNPTWAKVEEGAALANGEGVDFILAVGGGSVMDCAKAVSLAANQEKAWKKHWVRAQGIVDDVIPHGYVVTCAGSGSEGNGTAVITNEKAHLKTGTDFPELYGRFAIMEPELTFTVSRKQTIAGSYETLTRLMELYFSAPMGNIIADSLLETAMRNVINSLATALQNPQDYNARANLMWASSLAANGMLQCGKQGIFQVQMIERQIGAYANCSAGEAFGAILAPYYRFIKATSIFMTYQLKRFAMNVWGISAEGKDDVEVAIEGIDALETWTNNIGAHHTLSELGVTEELVGKIGRSTKIIEMKYCKLTSDDIEILLEQCL